MGFTDLLPTDFSLDAYRALIHRSKPGETVRQILSTLSPDSTREGVALISQPLQLSQAVILRNYMSDDPSPAEFSMDWAQLDDPVAQFEQSSEIFRKHTWAFPSAMSGEAISLYEEFKLLAGLVHASQGSVEPVEELTLVAVDFPGIQRMIYTITSKGAAKGLRGRSFFLQLLSDAVARRMLAALDLPWLNLVYMAGANFVLLAEPGAQSTIQPEVTELNRKLLTNFQGDISLSVAYQTIALTDLWGDTFLQQWYALKRQLGENKLRPFADQVLENWEGLFTPQGIGTEKRCVVCHREPEIEDLPIDEVEWWCDECKLFDELARTLAEQYRYLSVADEVDPTSASRWQNRLFDLTGWWYELHDQLPQDGRAFYVLNHTDFMEDHAVGFRFLATRTPYSVTQRSIRDFEQLSEESHGIRRIGILRMDVDNLGKVFGSYMPEPNLAVVSAASSEMSLFFNGWLNKIFEDLETERPDTLYAIYAGGDDLFIVGPWDMMPMLAQRIRDDFTHYVDHNPYLTISAGIAVIEPHYPLYRAAEEARIALDDRAKGRKGKNAISFLGQVVGWDDGWQLVVREKDRMLGLLDRGMPKALHQTVRRIYMQYLEERQIVQGSPDILYYGRWMWMQAYSLTRLVERYAERIQDAKHQIQQLQGSLLNPQTIHLAGLAARWTELLDRQQESEIK